MASPFICFLPGKVKFRGVALSAFTYMQLAIPKVVAMAVRIVMISCNSIFHVSRFILVAFLVGIHLYAESLPS